MPRKNTTSSTVTDLWLRLLRCPGTILWVSLSLTYDRYSWYAQEECHELHYHWPMIEMTEMPRKNAMSSTVTDLWLRWLRCPGRMPRVPLSLTYYWDGWDAQEECHEYHYHWPMIEMAEMPSKNAMSPTITNLLLRWLRCPARMPWVPLSLTYDWDGWDAQEECHESHYHWPIIEMAEMPRKNAMSPSITDLWLRWLRCPGRMPWVLQSLTYY